MAVVPRLALNALSLCVVQGFYPRAGDNKPDGASVYLTYHWAKVTYSPPSLQFA